MKSSGQVGLPATDQVARGGCLTASSLSMKLLGYQHPAHKIALGEYKHDMHACETLNILIQKAPIISSDYSRIYKKCFWL